MTGLSYVDVEEYYGHTLSVCTSVIVENILNVLTLIETLKKIAGKMKENVGEKKCYVNMIVRCIACGSGKFNPIRKHAFP